MSTENVPRNTHTFSRALVAAVFVMIAGAFVGGRCAELAAVSPITDTLLLLYFDEGYVRFHKLGQNSRSDVVIKQSLDVDKAAQTGSYSIKSSDDPAYSSAESPLKVGRKSRVQETGGTGVVWEHFMYLVLPKALSVDKHYTISMNGIGSDRSDTTIVFDPSCLRSEAVHVSQIGFRPSANKKYAYISQWMGDLGPLEMDSYAGTPFHILDAETGEKKFTGTIALRSDLETAGPENGQGEGTNGSLVQSDVWECDFSAFDQAGRYVVSVERIGCSFPFDVDEDVYRTAFQTTCRALYHKRCGIELKEPYTKWVKPRCHHQDDGLELFQSTWRRTLDGNEHNGAFTNLPTHSTGEQMPYWGGWHDASDFDRKSGHMGVSRELLFAYECFPQNFADGELNIPESGNGIPDIVDEARWGIDFCRRMQKPDGGVCGGIETTGHPGHGVSSATEDRTWYVYAPEPAPSYDYAAGASALAHVFRMLNKDSLADDYIATAKKAFDWAENYASDSIKVAECDTTDGKICRHHDQYRLLALAWLYRVTGDDAYQQEFKTSQHITNRNDWLQTWKRFDQEWASFVYALADHDNVDTELQDTIKAAVVWWAEHDRINTSDRRAYRFGYHFWAKTGYSTATTPEMGPLMAAYRLTQDQKYLDYMHTSADYYLGGNPMNMCWVAGLGSRSPTVAQVMDHDSWYHHAERGLVPGIVPYGPCAFRPSNQFYPYFDGWAPHETWAGNRYRPATNEYTIGECIGRSAATYGALCAAVGGVGRKEHGVPAALSAANTVAPRIVKTDGILRVNFASPHNYAVRLHGLNGATIMQCRGTGRHVALQTAAVPAGTYLLNVDVQGSVYSQRISVLR